MDTEGRWIKKAGKLMYGYKKHFVTDTQGMVLNVVTITANVNEITNLEEVLHGLELAKGTPILADKGYASAKNRKLLKDKELKDRILKKAVRGKALTAWEQKFNKLISKVRYKVERTFGSIRLWFRCEKARCLGMVNTHTQHLMEAFAYNLHSSPRIVAFGRE